ncbi:MAG: FkbM family methyltransferase [Mucilaginibacter sp.]
MKKNISTLFHKSGNLSKRFFDKIARTIYTAPPTLKDKAWGDFCAAGGESLRFNYNSLDKNSVIFDLGGYEGQWASDIYSRFRSMVYIFEVYKPYYDKIQERFNLNNDIKIFNYGLSSENTVVKIAIDDVSTSAFKKSENMVDVQLKNIADFIAEHDIQKIDLMKINIEGGEFDLLAYLISSGIVKQVVNLQIQFHDFVPDAINKMATIRNELSKTHKPTYQFDFIWDNWELKETTNLKND